MKKRKDINIALLVSLAVLAAISFGPCIKDTVAFITPYEGPGIDGYIEYCSYLPILFCTITGIEILLAIVSGKPWLRGIGILLHVYKTVTPIVLFRLGILESMGGLNSHSYTPSWLGYILFLVSLWVLMLYVMDILKE